MRIQANVDVITKKLPSNWPRLEMQSMPNIQGRC